MRLPVCIALWMLSMTLCTVAASAQLRVLPAEPPMRLDPVLAATLKVRLTKEALATAPAVDVLQRLGLRLLRPILPLHQSLQWKNRNALGVELLAIPADVMRYEDELLRSFVVSYPNTAVAPERMCAWLRPGCSAVEIAEPYTLPRLLAEPNDSLRTSQAMLTVIRVFEAWDIEEGHDSVRIGISDSGVLQQHEDLKDAIYVNNNEIPNNLIDDDANGYVDDYNGYNFCSSDDGSPPGNTNNPREGHGTGVAGICGAVVNNGLGIAGIANKCKIVPLKTMPDDVGGIVYGYESMIYCVVNGIDIVNCSWGSQSRSCIDESVVQYTIARGVAVVAAAGNHYTPAPFFPAAYKGVLGVGVSSPDDQVIDMSCTGPTVDLMAPGHATLTTSSNGGYGAFCCTSGAAPIVSGVVGLVRAKHPTLSPVEICAIVREAVARNPWTFVPDTKTIELLPVGRLDAYASVTVNPDSVPSVELDTLLVNTTSDDTRWTVGDTLRATLRLRNVLAAWTPSAVLTDIAPFTRSLEVGVSALSGANTRVGSQLEHGEVFDVTVPLLVTKDTDTSSFIRLRYQSADSAITQVLAAVTPSPAYRVLRNNALVLSVGDNARIGNVDVDRGQGTGLTYRGFCAQLYEGGLMIGAGGNVVDAVRGEHGTNNHFLPIKRFTRPDPLTGIVRDDRAPDTLRIGVEVTQDVRLAEGDSGIFISDITIKNISDSTLRDITAAWFLDWDVGTQPAHNRTELVEYDLQRHLGIEGAWSTHPGEPYVVCAAISTHSDASPICAGFDNTVTYNGFAMRTKDSLMRSGAGVQQPNLADVAVVSGMRFTDHLPPGGIRSLRIVWSLELDRAAALQNAQAYLTTPAPLATVVSLPYPNPADEQVSLSISSAEAQTVDIAVFDLQGRQVLEQSSHVVQGDNVIHMDVRTLGVGMYAVRVSASGIHRFVFCHR